MGSGEHSNPGDLPSPLALAGAILVVSSLAVVQAQHTVTVEITSYHDVNACMNVCAAQPTFGSMGPPPLHPKPHHGHGHPGNQGRPPVLDQHHPQHTPQVTLTLPICEKEGKIETKPAACDDCLETVFYYEPTDLTYVTKTTTFGHGPYPTISTILPEEDCHVCEGTVVICEPAYITSFPDHPETPWGFEYEGAVTTILPGASPDGPRIAIPGAHPSDPLTVVIGPPGFTDRLPTITAPGASASAGAPTRTLLPTGNNGEPLPGASPVVVIGEAVATGGLGAGSGLPVVSLPGAEDGDSAVTFPGSGLGGTPFILAGSPSELGVSNDRDSNLINNNNNNNEGGNPAAGTEPNGNGDSGSDIPGAVTTLLSGADENGPRITLGPINVGDPATVVIGTPGFQDAIPTVTLPGVSPGATGPKVTLLPSGNAQGPVAIIGDLASIDSDRVFIPGADANDGDFTLPAVPFRGSPLVVAGDPSWLNDFPDGPNVGLLIDTGSGSGAGGDPGDNSLTSTGGGGGTGTGDEGNLAGSSEDTGINTNDPLPDTDGDGEPDIGTPNGLDLNNDGVADAGPSGGPVALDNDGDGNPDAPAFGDQLLDSAVPPPGDAGSDGGSGASTDQSLDSATDTNGDNVPDPGAGTGGGSQDTNSDGATNTELGAVTGVGDPDGDGIADLNLGDELVAELQSVNDDGGPDLGVGGGGTGDAASDTDGDGTLDSAGAGDSGSDVDSSAGDSGTGTDTTTGDEPDAGVGNTDETVSSTSSGGSGSGADSGDDSGAGGSGTESDTATGGELDAGVGNVDGTSGLETEPSVDGSGTGDGGTGGTGTGSGGDPQVEAGLNDGDGGSGGTGSVDAESDGSGVGDSGTGTGTGTGIDSGIGTDSVTGIDSATGTDSGLGTGTGGSGTVSGDTDSGSGTGSGGSGSGTSTDSGTGADSGSGTGLGGSGTGTGTDSATDSDSGSGTGSGGSGTLSGDIGSGSGTGTGGSGSGTVSGDADSGSGTGLGGSGTGTGTDSATDSDSGSGTGTGGSGTVSGDADSGSGTGTGGSGSGS
ncbi:uncharacterized protein J7T54_007184, partial [Emericellopsis cladophorae]